MSPYRFAADIFLPSFVGGEVMRALEKLDRQANMRLDVMAAAKLTQLKLISERVTCGEMRVIRSRDERSWQSVVREGNDGHLPAQKSSRPSMGLRQPIELNHTGSYGSQLNRP